ncbi:MAG: hypothetical protein WCA84_05770 [Ignavibacteriaceae bacterium]
MYNAPICLFCYNRPELVEKTLYYLKRNYLATESELFIFSDGPKNDKDLEKIKVVRNIIQKTNGFKNKELIIEDSNRGLAKSIIQGVSNILNNYQKVIVLEDDLISSPNFLNFMNQALGLFDNNDNIFSISGFNIPISIPPRYDSDIYLARRPFSWGWATWKDKWNNIQWDINNYANYINDIKIMNQFGKISQDLPRMLRANIEGKIDSWYIRWAFNHFISNKYCVYPCISKIFNNGYYYDSSNCKGFNIYSNVKLDNTSKIIFNFDLLDNHKAYFEKQFAMFFSYKNKLIQRLKLLKSLTGIKIIYNDIKYKIFY